jgi:cysteine desulfurase/selenocysteine lyase
MNHWRRHFPALDQDIEGHPLIYLDSAATTQRPEAVVSAIADFYRRDNANPGAAMHTLARRAAERLEEARAIVASLVGAQAEEIIFTRGTTDGINLVAASWGAANLRPDDEILLSVAEHASNLVPWQLIAARTGARLEFFDVHDDGTPNLEDFAAKLGPRTRLVAVSHISNVLGLINPIGEIVARARRAGAKVLVDGAQSVPHIPVDVRALDCDFMAFSSHKMLGPMGVGVLWVRPEVLDAMPPYQGGSNMAHDVPLDGTSLDAHLSHGVFKFGAGTPNASGPIGLAAAVQFLQAVGYDALRAHEQSIIDHALERLASIPSVRLLGSRRANDRIAVFSFTVDGRKPLDVLRWLDARGIAVRAGDLASRPLLERLGTTAAVRASCYLYTTRDEIDAFADALDALTLAPQFA